MSGPDERVVVANRLAHHVLVWNDGGPATVVLCHGFLDHAWSWRWVAPHLAAAGLRVVAFDWRGHGDTDRVGPGGYYHFADYVLDLHDLLPAIAAGGDLHLVGHSMGGAAVCLFAGTHPSALETLTVVEGLGPPAYTKDPPEKTRAWLASMDRVRAAAPKAMADLAEAVKRLRATWAEVPVEVAYAVAETGTRVRDDGRLEWKFDPLHRTTSPGVFDVDGFLAYLRRIEAPTLLVRGERGFATADHDARARAIPHRRERTLPGVGHMIHWLAPEALARAILAHVERAP